MRATRSVVAGVAAVVLLAPASACAQLPEPGQIALERADYAGVTAPQLLLQARVAGVEVIGDPTPGGGVTVRIRRGATLLNSEPLYVIDGLPLNFLGGFSAGGNPLDFVDVADVERIVVLKNGAETAHWGARGGNGVVLIETRRGGHAGFDYTGWLGASTPLGAPDVLDAGAFRELVAAYDAREGTDLSARLGDADTDWRDEVQRTGVAHDHSLAWAGGGEELSYRLSVAYSNTDGVVQRSAAERASFAAGYAQTLSDRLQLRATLRGSHAEDVFLAPGVLRETTRMAPTQPVRDPASPYGGFFEWPDVLAARNPVAILELTDDAGTTRRIFGVAEARLTFPTRAPLAATFRFGRDASRFERDASQSPELRSQAELPEPGYRSALDGDMANTLLAAFVEHRRDFGALRLDATGGWSSEEFDVDADFEREQGTAGGGWSMSVDGDLTSIFGDVDFALRDRYVLSLGVRSDGNEEERWTYPSAAAAWRVADEPFMDGAPLGELTLRASWGRSGTLEITRLLFPSAFEQGETMSRLQFGGGSPGSVFIDPELEPERVDALDFGVDVASRGGRVRASVETYIRTTHDLHVATPVIRNAGMLTSRGVELTVSADVLRALDDGLQWTADLTVAGTRSELTELDGVFLVGPGAGVGNFIQVMAEGAAPFAFFLMKPRADNPDFGDMDGDADVDASDLYVDLDGDGVVTSDDREAGGNPAPDWIVGHRSRVRWRTFDAALTLRAHVGNRVFDNVAAERGSLFAMTEVGVPSNVHESVNETGFEGPQYLSGHYLQDASFLRVDEVSLGWTPYGGSVRVFGAVRNALTLTEYRGADPEVGPSGIDYGRYPRARMAVVGANVRF